LRQHYAEHDHSHPMTAHRQRTPWYGWTESWSRSGDEKSD